MEENQREKLNEKIKKIEEEIKKTKAQERIEEFEKAKLKSPSYLLEKLFSFVLRRPKNEETLQKIVKILRKKISKLEDSEVKEILTLELNSIENSYGLSKGAIFNEDKALECFEKLEEFAKRNIYLFGKDIQAEEFWRLAMEYKNRGNYGQAKIFYEKAKKIWEEMGEHERIKMASAIIQGIEERREEEFEKLKEEEKRKLENKLSVQEEIAKQIRSFAYTQGKEYEKTVPVPRPEIEPKKGEPFSISKRIKEEKFFGKGKEIEEYFRRESLPGAKGIEKAEKLYPEFFRDEKRARQLFRKILGLVRFIEEEYSGLSSGFEREYDTLENLYYSRNFKEFIPRAEEYIEHLENFIRSKRKLEEIGPRNGEPLYEGWQRPSKVRRFFINLRNKIIKPSGEDIKKTKKIEKLREECEELIGEAEEIEPMTPELRSKINQLKIKLEWDVENALKEGRADVLDILLDIKREAKNLLEFGERRISWIERQKRRGKARWWQIKFKGGPPYEYGKEIYKWKPTHINEIMGVVSLLLGIFLTLTGMGGGWFFGLPLIVVGLIFLPWGKILGAIGKGRPIVGHAAKASIIGAFIFVVLRFLPWAGIEISWYLLLLLGIGNSGLLLLLWHWHEGKSLEELKKKHLEYETKILKEMIEKGKKLKKLPRKIRKLGLPEEGEEE